MILPKLANGACLFSGGTKTRNASVRRFQLGFGRKNLDLLFLTAARFEFFSRATRAVVVTSDFDGGTALGKGEFDLGLGRSSFLGDVGSDGHVSLRDLSVAGRRATHFHGKVLEEVFVGFEVCVRAEEIAESFFFDVAH